ncbi:unnamed protein product [Haemonchus placei]|uniref:Transposase n=1 Tax=Haemonchus placei TaxID=6290 RepID=A0A0N4W464_HAEPC|nr:unnamed protein product [Haemonchus placei]
MWSGCHQVRNWSINHLFDIWLSTGTVELLWEISIFCQLDRQLPTRLDWHIVTDATFCKRLRRLA